MFLPPRSKVLPDNLRSGYRNSQMLKYVEPRGMQSVVLLQSLELVGLQQAQPNSPSLMLLAWPCCTTRYGFLRVGKETTVIAGAAGGSVRLSVWLCMRQGRPFP